MESLQGWKRKFFSTGGKEVLIKAVAQAILVYTMSSFKLPRGFCDDINSMCASFWWGSELKKNKIHWKNWSALCKSKQNDGLGFRDISIFNQAILAKQSWRIFNNPNSLLSIILKGRYFHSSNFLEANLGSRPSYTWRSILWGRKLFKQGYRWIIGPGSIVSIKKYNWFCSSVVRKPISVPQNLSLCRVSALLNPDGS